MTKKEKRLEKKNLIIIGIFIVAVFIIIFGGALIYNKFFFNKSYSDVETIMVDAAKKYLSKNKEKLPQTINKSITIPVSTLVKYDNMNEINSYIKNNKVTCDGEVTVTNINGDYRYTSMLDCGDAYQTKTLTDYIKKNTNIVTSGNGLYELNNELVYRGDKVDNYLKLNNKTYRIVKLTEDERIVVIFTDFPDESVVWDDRYNINNDYDSGINDFKVSRMRDYLDNMYNNTSDKALLSKNAKMLVTSYNLPIGARNNADTDKSGSLEKTEIIPDQYIGLLPVNDFLNASTDENCTSTISKSCKNYNYLSKYKYTWWTITPYSKNTYKVYTINKFVKNSEASNTAYIRPVLYLTSNTIYVSGNGSKDNPYIIK